MKKRLNVLKKEAEQICLWGEAIHNESNYLMICDDGKMVFDIYGGSDDTTLSYENEYKDYEWRLTNTTDLKRGDVCRYIINDLPHIIFVFDHIIDEEQQFGWFWCIADERPRELVIARSKIYKLFKKAIK